MFYRIWGTENCVSCIREGAFELYFNTKRFFKNFFNFYGFIISHINNFFFINIKKILTFFKFKFNPNAIT